MEYLDLTSDDLAILNKEKKSINYENANVNAALGFIFVFISLMTRQLNSILILGGMLGVPFFILWNLGNNKSKVLQSDYDGGKKVRFKAKILNLKNVPREQKNIFVELGGNELDVYQIKIPIYPNINIGDILLIEMTPKKHIVLNCEKI
jgi:hypothetical protein